jgi:tetratricopeptide (TPR) repeat protein
VGDRYLYVAFAGLAVSVALGLSAVWQRRRGLVLLWAVVPALALGTWSRALEWQDDASVFRASLERDPHNPHAAFHLAHALHAHAGDCAAAAPLYHRALEADPRAGNNLQACLLDLGRIEEAARMGPRLAARDPENATPAANTARAHLRLRQLDPAEHWAREALRRNPDRARSWTLLGEVLGSRGELLAARDAFREAIARDPDDVGATRGREAAEALLARRGG